MISVTILLLWRAVVIKDTQKRLDKFSRICKYACKDIIAEAAFGCDIVSRADFAGRQLQGDIACRSYHLVISIARCSKERSIFLCLKKKSNLFQAGFCSKTIHAAADWIFEIPQENCTCSARLWTIFKTSFHFHFVIIIACRWIKTL